MMRKLVTLLVPLMVALAMSGTASAKELNVWHQPGLSPYADTKDQATKTREQAFKCLGLKGEALQQVMRATAVPGQMVPLKDDEVFTRQVYKGCQVIRNVKVAFGNHGYNRDAERWAPITLADGTKIIVVHPYGCHNWSIIVIPPKPPVRTTCVRFNYDYTRRSRVTLTRADALAAEGHWYGSKAQLTLHPEAEFAFVLVHIEVTDAELLDLVSDECFGYADATGFHHEVTRCVEFCVSGEYPNDRMLAALLAERGIHLPAREPNGSFRFPLAGGKGYLSLPARYARRFSLHCAETELHPVTLQGFAGWRSMTDFDIVTAEQASWSLERRNAVFQEGDFVLTNTAGVRYLYGELQF